MLYVQNAWIKADAKRELVIRGIFKVSLRGIGRVFRLHEGYLARDRQESELEMRAREYTTELSDAQIADIIRRRKRKQRMIRRVTTRVGILLFVLCLLVFGVATCIQQFFKSAGCVSHIVHHAPHVDQPARNAHIPLLVLPLLNELPLSGIMHVAVEHNGSVVLVLIEHDGLVAHDDQRIPVVDFSILLDALPMELQPAVDSVVISSDQVLVTVEPLDDLHAVFFVLPEGVAKNVDGIIACDALVPVVNQHFIHQIRIRKRTVVEAEHVLVSEVHIRDVINHGFSLSSFSVGGKLSADPHISF